MTQDQGTEHFDVAAVDHHRAGPLYAPRTRIHPKRARGTFRRFKWWIMAITLTIYYVTPWVRWDRGVHVSDQAVLVDLANHRFFFFFIEIWPHEFYFVAGLLVMAGIGLFLVTSTVGRAWCGYACPQTVWVDLFLVVERFFEGDRNARIRLDDTPWSLDKIRKRVSKHAVWIVISVATGGAWIFYFADAPRLAADFLRGEAPGIAYATVAILTATTYILGGHLREQVCVYMCPWPRIQGAMLDEDSLTVTYNAWRGEPRSRHVRRNRSEGRETGDCVDCNACVAVCPTGIDIRNGQQLECITCALCIDACDGVMQRLGQPKGLISYATLRDYEANMALARGPDGNIEPHRVRDADGGLHEAVRSISPASLLRLRTLAYAAAWTAVGLMLLGLLLTRDHLELHVVHDRNPVFVRLTNGTIRNGYTVKILNMHPEPRAFRLAIEDLPGARLRVAGDTAKPTPDLSITVRPDALRSTRVYVHLPAAEQAGPHTPFNFHVEAINDGETARYEAVFEGPGHR